MSPVDRWRRSQSQPRFRTKRVDVVATQPGSERQMANQPRKCEHFACRCLVEAGGVFCSAHCEEHANDTAIGRCGCAHGDCDQSIVEMVPDLVPA